MKSSSEHLQSADSGMDSFIEENRESTSLPVVNSAELERSRAVKKQSEIKKQICKLIWDSEGSDLQEILKRFPFSEEVGLTAKGLVELKGVKLIRSEHRIYFGQVNKTKKSGIGISIYSDGRLYQGFHVNNDKSGLGYELYNNGNVYIGTFDRNKKHGRGVFYWLNLEDNGIFEYFEGDWWDGLPSGMGRHQRCNGDVYEGQFKNGLKHGQGTELFFNGDAYIGQYINGLPEGYGEYIWSNGSNYKGEFKQGLRYGFGCWKKDNTENSESYRGHYVLDLKSGHGIYTWPDNKFYKGEFFNDKKHGFGELYHKDILKYRGNWAEGKPKEDPSKQSGEDTKRMRSQSGSSHHYNSIALNLNNPNNNSQNINHNNSSNSSFNQLRNTQRVINFRAQTRSRQPTIESANSLIKEIKLKRPSSVAPIDLRSLQKNTVYRTKGVDIDSKTEILNHCGRKCGHKNCIPTYPWEQRKSVVKQ